jgi:hypothetical protein
MESRITKQKTTETAPLSSVVYDLMTLDIPVFPVHETGSNPSVPYQPLRSKRRRLSLARDSTRLYVGARGSEIISGGTTAA